MRISISKKEAEQIINLIASKEELQELKVKIESEIKKEPSLKLVNASKKATQTRVNQAKEKIVNAINLMRLEQRKININAVAREAKVSYNTVKKYEELIKAQSIK